VATFKERFARTNTQLLTLASDLPEASFARRAGPRAPAVRFHVFHLGRWADTIQWWLPRSDRTVGELLGDRPMIWEADQLAKAWGLEGLDLGVRGTGAGLADDDAAALNLPPKDKLLGYAKQALGALEDAMQPLTAQHFEIPVTNWVDERTTVGGALLHHLIHANRHLGMIEALRGVMGVRGTATR
jgi:hypothetical protein